MPAAVVDEHGRAVAPAEQQRQRHRVGLAVVTREGLDGAVSAYFPAKTDVNDVERLRSLCPLGLQRVDSHVRPICKHGTAATRAQPRRRVAFARARVATACAASAGTDRRLVVAASAGSGDHPREAYDEAPREAQGAAGEPSALTAKWNAASARPLW